MDLQNQKLSYKNTDIKNKLDQALKALPNLSTIYSKGNDETKKTLMCSIFKEKLQFLDNALDKSSIITYIINKQHITKEKKRKNHQ